MKIICGIVLAPYWADKTRVTIKVFIKGVENMATFGFVHNPLVRFDRLVEQGEDFPFAEVCTTIDQITLQKNADCFSTCFAIIGGCVMRISLTTYDNILSAKKEIARSRGSTDAEYDFRENRLFSGV